VISFYPNLLIFQPFNFDLNTEYICQLGLDFNSSKMLVINLMYKLYIDLNVVFGNIFLIRKLALNILEEGLPKAVDVDTEESYILCVRHNII
jgi:hypothetical protein